MASTDGVSRLYDRLSPAERTTLVLEAKARKEEAEADRLMGSCPHRSYTAMDAEFTERMNLAFDKMAAGCIVLQHLGGKLEAVHAALGMLDGFAECYRLSAALAFFEGVNFAAPDSEAADQSLARAAEVVRGKAEGDDGDPGPELLERINRSIGRAEAATVSLRQLYSAAAVHFAQELTDAWRAFDRFSRRRVGVSPEVLLAAWGFPPDMAGSLRESLKPYEGHLHPREEQVVVLFDAMSQAWVGRFGDDEGGRR